MTFVDPDDKAILSYNYFTKGLDKMVDETSDIIRLTVGEKEADTEDAGDEA